MNVLRWSEASEGEQGSSDVLGVRSQLNLQWEVGGRITVERGCGEGDGGMKGRELERVGGDGVEGA